MKDQIELRLCDELSKFPDVANGKGMTDAQWTKGIKEIVGCIGIEYGYKICAAGVADKFDPEWLYDLLWYRGENGKLDETPLIMESEWKTSLSDIIYDFEKLLVGKSRYKLMIYQAKNSIEIKNINNVLVDEIHNYKYAFPGERYLLVGLNWETFSFEFCHIVI